MIYSLSDNSPIIRFIARQHTNVRYWYILKQYSLTQPGFVPKLVATLALSGLWCGHVMLSTWPKDCHTLSVSCMPFHLCSCSWVLSGSRSTPWPAWFSDVLLFPTFWTLMDRKDTMVSTEDDKDREELHIRNVLKSCGYPKWIFDKVKHDQRQKRKWQ